MNQPTVTRPICGACGRNPCAVNYWRNGVRHWRSRCGSCMRRGRGLLPPRPRWLSGGYTKKSACDLCGFRARYPSQITVWHINGNLNDVSLTNLRSVCLNCIEDVKRRNFTWRPGDLQCD